MYIYMNDAFKFSSLFDTLVHWAWVKTRLAPWLLIMMWLAVVGALFWMRILLETQYLVSFVYPDLSQGINTRCLSCLIFRKIMDQRQIFLFFLLFLLASWIMEHGDRKNPFILIWNYTIAQLAFQGPDNDVNMYRKRTHTSSNRVCYNEMFSCLKKKKKCGYSGNTC